MLALTVPRHLGRAEGNRGEICVAKAGESGHTP
jgi:hypothetical protein